MTAPNFGMQFLRTDDSGMPVIASNMDVVGLVGPCSTADATRFPLNTPVLVYSNDTTLANALGTDGYLVDAINGINAQLATFQVAAMIVIVRTDYGTASDAPTKLQQTISKIMGNSAAGTGVWALAAAPNELYCTPRLLMAPGYTGQQANTLDVLSVTTGGVGYIPGATYEVTFAAGSGETNGANMILPMAHAIAKSDSTISEADIVIDSIGAWMTVAPLATLPAADGPAVTALPAEGQIIFSQNPGIGSTITLNGSTVTFASAPSAGATTSAATLTGGNTGVAATGSIVFNTNPSNNDSITLGGTKVTFVKGTPSGNSVQIGASLSATLTALGTFLNASADSNIVQCSYSATSTTLNVTDKTTGVGGNSYTLAASVHSMQVALANNLNDTLTGLTSYLNNSSDVNISKANYTQSAGGVLNIVMIQGGASGNSWTITSTVTGSTYPATLSGGRDAAASVNALLSATIALGANPVCSTFGGGLSAQLAAHAIIESAGTSQIDDENWRDTLASQRLIAMTGGCLVQDPNSGSIVARPVASRVVGAIIARDFATGGPFHSAANFAIQGIVGPGRSINFSLTDGSTEGQQLLAANIGIIARGEVGVETAIAPGGFVLIATDNLSNDPEWQFYNVTRGRDFIELSLMTEWRPYLGSSNIDYQTVSNCMKVAKNFLGSLYASQQILGFNVSLSGIQNPASDIRAGKLTVQFAAEEPSVLKVITSYSARYLPAIDALVSQLATQLNFTSVGAP